MTNRIKTCITVLLLFLCSSLDTLAQDKVCGVNFVSPLKKHDGDYLKSINRIQSNWVALTPFAFMTSGSPNVTYNTSKNWFGDTPGGIANSVRLARKHNQKILLKPHFWVSGEGWPGDFDLSTEADWKMWERQYEIFMMQMARIAESQDIEMLCIGTEFKIAIRKRRRFFEELINRLRKIYSGKLTYAANWDNFEYVTFWDQLDFIGIDAYFPLDDSATPSAEKLAVQWRPHVAKMGDVAEKHGKQILFTEYGYRSIDGCTWKQWELERIPSDQKINLKAQEIGYSALFDAVWEQSWFAGGYIWKWWDETQQAGGVDHSNYTPQNKPVETIIKTWYSK